MTYQETLQYMYEALPMFHRQGATAIKKDLTNIRALCEALGQPQQKLKCIHIAGTNGKGSVSHMMAAILQAHGYKTGLYVSPHYKDFRERIKLDGKLISKKAVVQFIESNRSLFNRIQPSFFEMTVAMAFSYFDKSKVDYAIIETGLGGRLDSTNIVHPLLSIITNISWDHSDLLGDSLEKIAAEKAGIIKHKVPVVIGRKQAETEIVFRKKAQEQQAEIFFSTDQNELKIIGDKIEFEFNRQRIQIVPSLKGLYQQENINTVLTACKILDHLKMIHLDAKHIGDALSNTSALTNMLGRWQQLSSHPDVYVESAHNEDGIAFLMRQLSDTPFNKLHLIIGFVKDKPLEKVLKQFPTDARYYFVKASIPRALDPLDLKSKALVYGLKGKAYVKPKAALRSAKKAAAPNDLIVVCGSIFVVGEVL